MSLRAWLVLVLAPALTISASSIGTTRLCGTRLSGTTTSSASSAPSATSVVAPSPTNTNSRHLRLVLLTESWQGLVWIFGDYYGGHVYVLGRQKNLVSGLKHGLVSIDIELFVTYMGSYIDWKLEGPQGLSRSRTAATI